MTVTHKESAVGLVETYFDINGKPKT